MGTPDSSAVVRVQLQWRLEWWANAPVEKPKQHLAREVGVGSDAPAPLPTQGRLGSWHRPGSHAGAFPPENPRTPVPPPHRGAPFRGKSRVCVLILLFCNRMPDIEHNRKYSAVQKRTVLKYKGRHDF